MDTRNSFPQWNAAKPWNLHAPPLLPKLRLMWVELLLPPPSPQKSSWCAQQQTYFHLFFLLYTVVHYMQCRVSEWFHPKILNVKASENNTYRDVLLTFIPLLMTEIWHDGNLYNAIHTTTIWLYKCWLCHYFNTQSSMLQMQLR